MPGMNTAPGFMGRVYTPNKLYGQYGNTVRSGMGFGSQGYDSRANGRPWLVFDSKQKPRGRFGYGNENSDGLNELNKGPRFKGGAKNHKGFAPNVLVAKGQNEPINATSDEEKDKTAVVPDREQYNRPDFPEDYTDAKFFVIKSYSEDDVHKSIKYNVWASTQNGNKKLHAAYQEAQEKSGDCPVFLFFSVRICLENFNGFIFFEFFSCSLALFSEFLFRSIPVDSSLALRRWLDQLILRRVWSTGNKTSGMAASQLSGTL
jgi:hypothetical protein